MSYYNKLPLWIYTGSQTGPSSFHAWFRVWSSTGDRRFLLTNYGTSNRINSWHGDEGRFKSKAGKNNR